MKTNQMKITASKTKVFRLKLVFPLVLFLDSCHVVVVCVCVLACLHLTAQKCSTLIACTR